MLQCKRDDPLNDKRKEKIDKNKKDAQGLSNQYMNNSY